MQVVKFLKKYGLKGEKQLKDKYGIIIKEYSDRIVLNYHQCNSPKFDILSMECRGLILSRPNYKILSRGFKRFWNYEQDPNKQNFDISKSTCYEKIDGTYISLYYDGKQWQISTRGTAFAEGNVGVSNETFRKMFLKILKKPLNHVAKQYFNTNNTYIFELVGCKNRIVTPYAHNDLYLLTIVTNHTGKEANINSIRGIATKLNIKVPKIYEFNNVEHIMKSMKHLPTLNEGYVLYDPRSNWRIKIKNPSYLAAAHLRENGVVHPKRIALLVMSNDYNEYLSYFPNDKKLFEPYIKAYNNMIKDIKTLWNKYCRIKNQKEFALAIQDCPAKSILFSMKNQHITISDVIDKMTGNGKLVLLENYKETKTIL